MILIKSSAKPRTAQPRATPKTARLSVSRSERTRYGTEIATKMISPPIVGVPALAWWPSGPSSRICWPNSRSRRYSMNFGPEEDRDQHRRHPGDQDLRRDRSGPKAEPVGLGEQIGHVAIADLGPQSIGEALQADRARALDEDGVAGAEQARGDLGGRVAASGAHSSGA